MALKDPYYPRFIYFNRGGGLKVPEKDQKTVFPGFERFCKKIMEILVEFDYVPV